MDIAASIQKVTEKIVLHIADYAHLVSGKSNLCLAGGVALNCVANGRIRSEGKFDSIWIQPAAGDAGGAIGAALAVWYMHLGNQRQVSVGNDSMKGCFLGPSPTDEGVKLSLEKLGAHFQVLKEADLLSATVNLIKDGAAIGWMQGRMEFGPRALGGRSIIADPRSEFVQRQLNLKVKFGKAFGHLLPVCSWRSF